MLFSPHVGYRSFHPVAFYDYQLARAYGLGLADGDELEAAAAGIRTRADIPPAMLSLEERARADGRVPHAMGYARIAEFFAPHGSPERADAYRRFRAAFDEVCEGSRIRRRSVPFDGGELPVYHAPARGEARGTVLLHGGFDSLIEEFAAIWERIADAGYEVFAFEGPGQGAAIELGLPHDWERPVAAVLDHLELERVTLVGLSMGGWWALRAASREPRVTAVVAWPPVYDWMCGLPRLAVRLVDLMLWFRNAMNLGIRFRMWLFPILDHAVRQAMVLARGTEPMDAVDWLRGMNAEALHSEDVHQPVFLMVGASDTFQRPAFADAQRAALTAAARVDQHTFTDAEQAGRHCQLSNVPLAVSVLTSWLSAHADGGSAQRAITHLALSPC